MLVLFLFGELRLHIPCWVHFYLGNFSYTSHAGVIFMCVVSLTHAGFIFIGGVSLTHPVLASLLFGEFVLHILRWLHFNAESFSYTSHADFVFMWGVSLTHPVLPSFSSGEFLLHIPCCLDFMQGLSLTPVSYTHLRAH